MKCSTTPSYYYYYYWLFATTIIHTIFLAKYHAVTAAAVVVDDYEASSSIRSGLRGGVEYASINKDDQSSNLNTNTNKDFRNKGSKSKLAKFDCTIQISTLLEIPSYSPPLAEDTIFSCTMNPSDVNGISGLTRNLDMNNDQKQTLKRMWKEGKLIPNESKLKLGGEDDGVEFDTRAIRLPMGLDLEGKVDNNRLKRYHGNKNNNNDMSDSTVNPPNIFHRHNRARHLTTTTGTKSILVVKVIDSENRQRPETPAQIGDDVFGTLGDPVNLASQLHACSMGKLTVRAGVHNENANAANRTSVLYAAPGVIEVHLPIPLTIADREVIHNSVTSATQEYLGFDLPGPYDHVMYVLEDCYGEDDCGWGAYAYVNHWVSVYRGKYYRDVGVQMHELGHNFGLEHSGGLDGKTYTDHTGMMGNPLYSDDTGKMCFNAAKNWQLGWYDDRKVTLQPIDATTNTIPPNWSTSYTMVGIADYLNIPNLPVILKLETNTDDDYFIGFNRATGVNLHNDEGDDLVTIVETGANGEGFSQSYLKGIIGDDGNGDAEVSDEYTIYNFADTGTNVTVRLSEIDRSTSVWKANVWVGAGTASYCDQKVSFTVNVTTDNYPTETSWTLTNKCSGSTTGTGVEVSKELGSYTDAQTSYSGTYWVCPGEYTFEIFDSYNDGICCAHSEGSYTIVYDGNVIPVATGGDFGISESTTFGICDSGDDDGPPAATSDPTKSPTILPTSSPTAQPTAQPSSQPTTGPSTQPTTQPTAQPSAQPTTQPTTQPSAHPSAQPSAQPKTPPSPQPTTQPTAHPSTQPTAHPSAHPSAQPSTQPTAQPSAQPSNQPTAQPSSQPTNAPTKPYCDQKVSFTVNVTTDSYPTETSWTLTNKCSGSTTGTGVEVSKELGSYTDAQTSYSDTYWVCPGEYTFEIFDSYNDGICCAHSEGSYTIVYDGNVIPVATGGDFGISESTTFGICDSGDDDGPPAATSDPTKSPTILPTSSPTAQPTAQPSSQPTNGPSTQPTTQPTAQPSAQPTTPPSTRPTTQPTTQPTAHPSAQPSTQPTAQPTNAPSKSPTPPPRGSVIATFDSILNAPKCSEIGTECTSELLLNGKSNNREPNGDNTLDSCADGTDGTYHGDESIDKIRVYTVPGGGGDVGGDLLREGDMAEIEAVVWAWRNGSEDTVDFYYAADVLANNNDNNPNWVFIGSEQPDGGGLRKVAVRYQLPAGSITTTQAVRVNLRWRGKQGGASGSCSGGRYDDVDDLVFSVAAAAATDASAESALNTFGAMSAIMSKAPDAPPLLKAKPQNWGCKSLGTSKERCEAASSTCRWKNGRRRKGCYDRK